MSHEAVEWLLGGRVQGVGFRPFIYLLARRCELTGWVRNTTGRVEIHAEGAPAQLKAFGAALIVEAPPLARPRIEREVEVAPRHFDKFTILASSHAGAAAVHVPPDQAACAHCERELLEPTDRRYRYPFINCTQCGPRYSIIRALPYDRSSTSMADFQLCARCSAEYLDPGDRRFHAEPNACAACGPQLAFYQEGAPRQAGNTALGAALEALAQGRILAVKGVGGYHLVCDAANAAAVMRLRRRKQRPHKPLALLAPAAGADGLDTVRQLVEIDDAAGAALLSPARPILLLQKRARAPVCAAIAPGLDELGVMLPPSPLHHLLARDFGKALVATSANISGEPVLSDDDEARQRLAAIAEGWLTHDRRILRPVDDSVARLIAGRPRVLRLGRGIAPLELPLAAPLPHPVVAVGGHMKNSVAIAWQQRVVISPHNGDLGSHRGQQIFRQVIADLQRLYEVEAAAAVCDLHPGYASSAWAKASGLPLTRVQHHRAHASALAGEHHRSDTGAVFTWDGVGLGSDGTLWGGEAFIGSPGKWRHAASLRPVRLAGGDRVAMQPWRSAAALHWELDEPYGDSEAQQLAHQAWRRGVNRITSTAVGRLFDAAAAMLGLTQLASHDGEAPMRLEAAAARIAPHRGLPLYADGALLRSDWRPLFELLRDNSLSVARRAGEFHAMLAATLCELALRFHRSEGINYVGLSGGVFQNALLVELIAEQLHRSGIELLLCEQIPVNDGGLAYGQIIEYAAGIKHHE
jgi:hydrogenase maturation protein HypF